MMHFVLFSFLYHPTQNLGADEIQHMMNNHITVTKFLCLPILHVIFLLFNPPWGCSQSGLITAQRWLTTNGTMRLSCFSITAIQSIRLVKEMATL